MKTFGWIVAIIVGLVLLWAIGTGIRSCAGVTERVTDPDNIIVNYEQYQDIYNTCKKLNTDLCNMRSTPETDKMFEQFSKAQRILALKTQLNKWVEDYNAKSKMITRNLWKSSELPYQLDVNQFNCYN